MCVVSDAIEPDYEAASVAGDKLMAENPRLPDTIPLYIVRRIVDAALDGRLVVPLDVTESEVR